MSSKTPFGWIEDPHSPWNEKQTQRMGLIADPLEQSIIVRIREMHEQQKSHRLIARTLNDESVPCRSGRWHHEQVRRVLRREGIDA